jgi:hypothetical protein
MTMTNIMRFQIHIGILLALSSTLALADDWQVSDLMQLLGESKAGKALFVEKKYIGIIDKPIESSGELAFTAPDRLEKRTLKPKAETLLLEGDKLTVDQPGKRLLIVDLQEHPEVAAFVESIRGTLSGDLSTLEKFYTLKLTGTAEEWQLELIPRQKQMLKVISRIQIGGTHADVKKIDFYQGDGDRSEMIIKKVIAQ